MIMESLTCLPFNLTYSHLFLMDFHCNRVSAYLLAMMSAIPSWCLLYSLPVQLMASPEFSHSFPVPVHLVSSIPMMARL